MLKLISCLSRRLLLRLQNVVARIRSARRPDIVAVQPLLMWLAGKSVAIVGNAQSLLDDCRYGAIIDSFDVVVRMNAGAVRDPHAQGSRTDLLAISTLLEDKAILQFAATHIILMSPRRRTDMPVQCGALAYSWFFYPLEWWRKLNLDLGARPSTGAMVIDLICRHSHARQVDVFGFDFKRSPTFYADQDSKGPHDFVREERFVVELAESCPHLTVRTAGATIEAVT
jgi:hypothetical protein